jgi:ATP synthase protein I
MTDPHDPAKRPRGDEASQLSDRLRRLEDALIKARPKDEKTAGGRSGASFNAQGLAQALRLSSEFVAGVLVGAGLGWLFDRFVGTSPWGLIVFLMLGFAAGVLNVLRAAGTSGPAPPSQGG